MSSPTPDPDRPEARPEHPGFGVCYRHPDRESGGRCARCSRPICPSCMITASVGFQCPECVKGAPQVRTLRSLHRDPHVTWALLAVNVAVYLPSLGGGQMLSRRGNPLAVDYALFGPAVAAGEWWRLVTSGFLHYGLVHIGFNMLILYMLGQMLEPALGRVRFAGIYLAALLAGSAGALLLSHGALTAGASGAVYGLMGAALMGQRRRGIDVMQSGLGGLLVINLLFTFAIPGISIGGHLGGLVGGAAAGGAVFALEDRPWWLGALACAAVAAVALAAGLVIAESGGL
jgi:membrane associated rhomboid family serine protease